MQEYIIYLFPLALIIVFVGFYTLTKVKGEWFNDEMLYGTGAINVVLFWAVTVMLVGLIVVFLVMLYITYFTNTGIASGYGIKWILGLIAVPLILFHHIKRKKRKIG
jgi:hypothetical protein